MANFEEENAQLRAELAAMKEDLAKAHDAMSAMMAAQEQPATSVPVTAEVIPSIPLSTVATDARFVMPNGRPYGLSAYYSPNTAAGVSGFAGQGQIPVSTAMPQVTTVVTDPVVHTVQQVIDVDTPRGQDPAMEAMKKQLRELAGELREVKASRGNNGAPAKARDLCLVSRFEVPKKFKEPEFDKYNGTSCPHNHVIRYVRKMANYADNDALMIHCFQSSLTDDAADWYTSLSKDNIHTFEELAAAFEGQYEFNTRLKPNRDSLKALSQKSDETFREYAQRWRGAAARVSPRLDEEELTQTFLKTLKKEYKERMIVSAPNNFSDMVTMGTRLEEAVRDGIIVLEKGESSTSAPKKYGNGHHKRKESDVGMVSGNPSAAAMQLPLPYQYMQYSQHPFFPPFYQQYPLPPGQPPMPVNAIPQQAQQQPPAQQQRQQQQGPRPKPSFPPIPMRYGELLPTLLAKGHCVTRPGKPPPNPLPPRFRQDLTCEFHQGAQGHDIEGCFALKYIVKDLIEKGRLTFENSVPHVLDNPLPNHAAVNMIEAFERVPVPQEDPMLDVRNVVTPLVPLHVKLCQASLFKHDHASCPECPQNPMGCCVVQNDIQSLMDNKHLIVSDVCVIVPVFHDSPVESAKNVEPLVIRLPGPVSYTSTKAIPYKYNATMVENGVEVPLVSPATVDNVASEVTALRSGKVRPPLFQKKVVTPIATITPPVAPPVDKNTGPAGQSIEESNLDEILRLIKKSDYKIVDQLLQTPSKISILSLLMSSEAHRKVLMKILEQAYVDHEVSIDQFDGIVSNITACNNLGFGDDELPEAGKRHNLALHISVHCGSDLISNVLVDTGSSLNVMPESTLRQLSHHGISLRGSSYLVKAFDGSRKDVLGEVDLPITVGPETFQITFQVMDINASYSCLLGRPWIHDAGAVTSTLHQKLKFMRNGKIVTVHGEEAYLVSQVSSFSCVEAGSAEGTSFQGLTVEGAEPRRAGASMASLKDAQKAVQAGQAAGWGKVIQILENKRKEGLGFSPTSAVSKGTFYSAGFINAITEDAAEGSHVPAFVIPGGTVRNWEAIDVPLVMHASM